MEVVVSNTRILGVCGLVSAMLGTLAGPVGATWPCVGFVVQGVASAVMLGANLVLIFRRER